MSTILVIILAALLIGFGVIGCFVAKIPGPLLSWLGLVVIHLFLKVPIDWWLIWIVLPVIIVGSMIFSAKVAPKLAAKVHEFGKAGKWGTFVGSMITLVLAIKNLPMWVVLTSLFVLPYVFAALFELISVKKPLEALKRGSGSYVLYLMTTLIKLIIVYLCFYFAFQNLFGDAEDAAKAARENPSYASIGERAMKFNKSLESPRQSDDLITTEREEKEEPAGRDRYHEESDYATDDAPSRSSRASSAIKHSYAGEVAGSKCTFDLVFTPMNDDTMTVNGSYYYNKMKSSIILRGEYNIESQSLNLTEYDDSGLPCSRMEFHGDIDSMMTGTFYRTDGKTFSIKITCK